MVEKKSIQEALDTLSKDTFKFSGRKRRENKEGKIFSENCRYQTFKIYKIWSFMRPKSETSTLVRRFYAFDIQWESKGHVFIEVLKVF